MRQDHDPNKRLIVALDVDTAEQAERIVDDLKGVVSCFKVGYQLFLSTGQAFVTRLAGDGNEVFFDLKLNDVGETIKLAVANLVRQCGNVKFLTLQGGAATVKAATEGRGGSGSPLLLSVPVLSSVGESDLVRQGLVGGSSAFQTLDEYLLAQAAQVIEAGADGLIASGDAIGLLRERFPRSTGKLIVSPGIRPSGTSTDDHKRSTTPGGAIRAGSDYLVVGRPIRDAADRRAAAASIVEEIALALSEQ